jgi:hypothetical protein
MIPRIWGMMLFDLQAGWAFAVKNRYGARGALWFWGFIRRILASNFSAFSSLNAVGDGGLL